MTRRLLTAEIAESTEAGLLGRGLGEDGMGRMATQRELGVF